VKNQATSPASRAFGATDDNKGEGEGDHAVRSRETGIIQQAERRRAPLQGDAKEAARTTTAAGENAITTTTTKGDGHNQLTATRDTKGPPNDHTNRREL
jgi:hypothetical protein